MITGSISELAAWLCAHDDFVVMGHVSPDGDCCGSCIAAVLALRSLGKHAYASVCGGMPKLFRHYESEGITLADTDDPPFEAKTAFVVDVSEAKRLGERNLRRWESCAGHATLDHHMTSSAFGEVYCCDDEAAATGELMVMLIEALRLPMTRLMATWLYIAIVTDCGRFGYSNTRPNTLRAAASLLEAGVDFPDIVRDLFHTATEAQKKLAGLVLNALQVSDGGRIVRSQMTLSMLKTSGALPEDKEGLVNSLLEIEGVEIAILAEEQEGGRVKLSLRSKKYADVARGIAVHFGGGGHARAAGCTVEGSVDEVLSQVLETARRAL